MPVELFKLGGACHSPVCCLLIQSSTGGFLLLKDFSVVVSHRMSPKVSQYGISVESSSLTLFVI